MANLISTISPNGSPYWEVLYGGQKLYPAPLIDFSRSINRNENKTALSQEDTYTLHGCYIESPSGSYKDIVVGMASLKSIFSSDYLELVIQAGAGNTQLPSGTMIVSGVYPYLDSIGIPQDTDQFRKFDYEVTLKARTAYAGTSGVVQSSSDTWNWQEDTENATTKVSHSVSAVGINTAVSGGSSNALSNARAFVISRLGAANRPSGLPLYVVPGDVNGVSGVLYEFQRTRTEQIDIENATYQVDEQFVFVSGTVPYSDARTYSYDRDSEAVVSITVAGTIQGYPRSDGTNLRYAAFYNAQSGFLNSIRPNINADASGVYTSYGASGMLAVGMPTQISFSENRFNGTLTYSYQFTDSPKQNLPSGIIEQSVNVQRKDAIRLMVSHIIPQRRLGNILQDINTPTVGTLTVDANAKAVNTGDMAADVNRAIARVQDLINQNRPNINDFITLRITDFTQTYDNYLLTAQASVVYEFTVDLMTVPDPSSDIILQTMP